MPNLLRGLAALALLVAPIWAQQAQLTGIVQDQSGSVVAGATVALRETATNDQQRTQTNDAGLYVFASVKPGTYRVTVTAPGFAASVLEELALDVAAKASRNFSLQLGSTKSAITVQAGNVEVNTENATVSTVVNRQVVGNMPLNGRSFQSLLTLAPGVLAVPAQGAGFGGEMTVNGQRTESNAYTVDGVSANTGALTILNSSGVGRGAGFSGSTPTQSAIGTTQSLVSLDALQEFRAITSTYSAEYGRTPGGQFAFQTRAGTNDWHGSAFEYFRNDKLDANNWFNNQAKLPRQAERQNDFGGTLGGPVRIPHLYNGRDRTFFFFSHESLRLRTPQAAMTYDVPSLELRANAPAALAPFLNAFPKPNGTSPTPGLASFTASYSSPNDLDSTSVRIDHSFSDNFKLFGRVSFAPSSSLSRQQPNMANVSSVEMNTKTLTLGATNILTPRASNELRVNHTWTDSLGRFTPDGFGGATPFQMSSVEGLGDANANLFFYLNFGLRPVLRIIPRDIYQKQWNVADTVTASFGRHMLKFGFDYRRIGNDQPLPSIYEYPVFNNATQVLQNAPQFVTLFRFGGGAMRPVYTNVSAFVQDEWKLTARLNLSLGLRWDVNPAPRDASGNDPYTVDQAKDLATTKLRERGAPLWNTKYANFAPRLGVAYRISDRPGRETVARAGVGLFYDTGNTLGTMGYWGVGVSSSTSYTGMGAPLPQSVVDATPAPTTATPYQTTVYGYDPELKLPRTLQWNVAVTQSLGTAQNVTLSYVGASGDRLLLLRQYYPGRLGNTNFKSASEFGNALQLTTNGAESNYQSLQAQFQRRLTRGVQAMAAWSWSHSVDTASSNFMVYQLQRASSDFDVRHNVQMALSWELPKFGASDAAARLWRGTAMDARVSMRSALPVDLIGLTAIDPNSGSSAPFHPNVVAGQPLYIDDSNAAGGRRINFAAFTAAPTGVEGNAGRNYARGFSASQLDLTLRRDFALGERAKLQARVEAFNVLNHPVFGSIYNDLGYGASRFGNAYTTQNSQLGGMNPIYQTGGPRSLQLALRVSF